MDYEKKYKEALERAKDFIEKQNPPALNKEFMAEIFPELKESEDERIRESLLEYLHTLPNHYSHDGVCAPEWIAWLEKRNSNVDNANKEYWRGYREGKQEILDKYAEIEKQSEQKSILNVPTREVILSIWDLGNEWKELTNGSISTEYGTQLDYIQKHWHESEDYLKEKQGEQKPANRVAP